MITVIVGKNCPNCRKLTNHLQNKGIKFNKLHLREKQSKEIINDRGIKGIPITIFRKGFVDIAKVGYSSEIVNYIEELYKNANQELS